jgi:hypothetical protein
LIEATNELMHQGPIRDWHIIIGEGVGQLLEPMIVIVRHHLALPGIMELTFKVDNVAWFISCKHATEVHPNLATSGAMKLYAHIQQISRDSGE